MSQRRRYQSSPSKKMSNGFVLPEGKLTPNALFVGGIDMMVEECEIRDFFKKFGLIREVKLISYRGGPFKGYGFVYFDEDVDIPKIAEQPVNFKGKKLKLGPAIMKERTYRSTQSHLFRQSSWMSPPQYFHCSCCSPMGGGVAPPSPMVSGGSPYSQPYSYSSLPGVMYSQMPMSYVPSYAQNGYNLQYVAPHWPGEQRTRLINQNYADCGVQNYGVQTVLTLL